MTTRTRNATNLSTLTLTQQHHDHAGSRLCQCLAQVKVTDILPLAKVHKAPIYINKIVKHKCICIKHKINDVNINLKVGFLRTREVASWKLW